MVDIKKFYEEFFVAGKISIDSRKIQERDIFFAFSGNNFNAATQAEKAIEKGASAVIVEDKNFENPHKNIFFVDSTLVFLQKLSAHHREQLKIPVIAITGSNGKTTTKELIYSVLSKKLNVQYTFGNLNNHIGVPLTLLSIDHQHEVAVVEMGANHKKEIQFLCSLAKPNIGYITSFGKAHLEGFGNFAGVVEGKLEMYDYLKENSQIILINENDSIQVNSSKNYLHRINFGKIGSNYYYQKLIENNKIGVIFGKNEIKSNLTGEYNFTNICAAISLGLHFGVSIKDIKLAIESYEPTNMRSQIIKKDNKILVLDTYNANPTSMALSLENFSKFEGSKTIIIGDMLELGEEAISEHENILNLTKSLNFNEIITIGKIFKKINNSEKSFDTYLELISFLKQNKINSKNILIKGSRGIALEKVLEFI